MSTLAPRGAELADGPSLRELFGGILGDKYDKDTNPNGMINIGTAENYIMIPEVSQFTQTHPVALNNNQLSYGEGPWGTPCLRRAMAHHMNKRFHPAIPVQPDDLLFANGVSTICELLGFSLASPGDAILMSSPIYQAFAVDFGTKAKVSTVHVSFPPGTDQFSPAAVAEYERVLLASQQAGNGGPKIRAILLCHPHNPLGRPYPRDTLIEFMKLCEKYQIHLLSDEIYAMSVYSADPPAFESVLAFDSTPYISPHLLHVLYGLSKDFAAGGLRIGCLYTRNRALWRAISAMSQFSWIPVASEVLACNLLEDDEWLENFFARARAKLAGGRRLVAGLLGEKGVRFYEGANAGFFLWVDLRSWLPPPASAASKSEEGVGKGVEEGKKREKVLVDRMFEKKVFLTPGMDMFAEEPGFFRLVFSQEEDVVREGLRRVFEAIGV
ncbi:PLP-dependent transferase [Hortaea werneckii]|nr:PLP-dependent transferase [Hortaea werneckii]KAI7080781.1 PLP-dependent transferase [Hortaea werneckii]KAI7204729.1 PLP-dependent transferase [Hortaea werneckii]KAI7294010.1 PLP-dependent transferase [Hortaea werneckii]KAI7379308.1 PLP-dependent transferase [Hortaea werneckii]